MALILLLVLMFILICTQIKVYFLIKTLDYFISFGLNNYIFGKTHSFNAIINLKTASLALYQLLTLKIQGPAMYVLSQTREGDGCYDQTQRSVSIYFSTPNSTNNIPSYEWQLSPKDPYPVLFSSRALPAKKVLCH